MATGFFYLKRMKLKTKKSHYVRNFRFLILLCLAVSCSGVKKIKFPINVDTTSKPIAIQKKSIFTTENMNVFASNQFSGAHLNGFEKINDSTVRVRIEPENTPINNSAYYSFKTWASNTKQVYFQFEYPEGYAHRYTPKIKKSNFPWRTIDSTKVFKKGGNTLVAMNLGKDTTWISAQEVVSSIDTEKWITDLINEKRDYISLESIGKSTLGKNIPALDISKGGTKNKDVIVLLTRHHPPEVTGFFAFKEFLQTILNDSDLSTKFLSEFRVLAFPILNPDGADLGNWRHNANGVDLNRDWGRYRQPEIRQIVHHITKKLKKDKGKLILGLDFHSTYEDVFYTNPERKKTSLPNFIEDWFEGLEKNIPGYTVNEKSGLSTRPVSKGWFLKAHGAVGITYEIGDETPRDQIQLVGKVSAEEMMKILLDSSK